MTARTLFPSKHQAKHGDVFGNERELVAENRHQPQSFDDPLCNAVSGALLSSFPSSLLEDMG